jgi:hypothetical protein
LRTQRAELLNRIEGLSRDECDTITLRLELVPREKIFDPDSNPRRLLLRYTRHVTSRADLDFIERTINERR